MYFASTGTSAVGTPDTYLKTKNVTIDLGGHTLTVENKSGRVLSLAADGITLKNGKVTVANPSTMAYLVWVTANAKDVVIENVEINGGMQVLGRSSATLKNVTVTAPLKTIS